jgi:uncharacterized phage-associated protein
MNLVDRSVAIANEFLSKPGGLALTQMQLQKLVYFAHGWDLALTNTPLTVEQPEAWTYGPVYRDLYDHTKQFGSAPIGRLLSAADSQAGRMFGGAHGAAPYKASLSPTERQIIDHVWHRYGGVFGPSLSALTHQPDTPWSLTFSGGAGKNQPINNSLIREHYRQLAQRAGSN